MIYIYTIFNSRKPQRIVPNGRCNAVAVGMVTYIIILYCICALFLMWHLQRRASATSFDFPNVLFETSICIIILLSYNNNNIPSRRRARDLPTHEPGIWYTRIRYCCGSNIKCSYTYTHTRARCLLIFLWAHIARVRLYYAGKRTAIRV